MNENLTGRDIVTDLGNGRIICGKLVHYNPKAKLYKAVLSNGEVHQIPQTLALNLIKENNMELWDSIVQRNRDRAIPPTSTNMTSSSYTGHQPSTTKSVSRNSSQAIHPRPNFQEDIGYLFQHTVLPALREVGWTVEYGSGRALYIKPGVPPNASLKPGDYFEVVEDLLRYIDSDLHLQRYCLPDKFHGAFKNPPPPSVHHQAAYREHYQQHRDSKPSWGLASSSSSTALRKSSSQEHHHYPPALQSVIGNHAVMPPPSGGTSHQYDDHEAYRYTYQGNMSQEQQHRASHSYIVTTSERHQPAQRSATSQNHYYYNSEGGGMHSNAYAAMVPPQPIRSQEYHHHQPSSFSNHKSISQQQRAVKTDRRRSPAAHRVYTIPDRKSIDMMVQAKQRAAIALINNSTSSHNNRAIITHHTPPLSPNSQRLVNQGFEDLQEFRSRHPNLDFVNPNKVTIHERRKLYEALITEFYKRYNPAQVPYIPDIMRRYENREDILMKELKMKYCHTENRVWEDVHKDWLKGEVLRQKGRMKELKLLGLKCKVCSKQCRSNADLASHMKRHQKQLKRNESKSVTSTVQRVLSQVVRAVEAGTSYDNAPPAKRSSSSTSSSAKRKFETMKENSKKKSKTTRGRRRSKSAKSSPEKKKKQQQQLFCLLPRRNDAGKQSTRREAASKNHRSVSLCTSNTGNKDYIMFQCVKCKEWYHLQCHVHPHSSRNPAEINCSRCYEVSASNKDKSVTYDALDLKVLEPLVLRKSPFQRFVLQQFENYDNTPYMKRILQQKCERKWEKITFEDESDNNELLRLMQEENAIRFEEWMKKRVAMFLYNDIVTGCPAGMPPLTPQESIPSDSDGIPKELLLSQQPCAYDGCNRINFRKSEEDSSSRFCSHNCGILSASKEVLDATVEELPSREEEIRRKEGIIAERVNKLYLSDTNLSMMESLRHGTKNCSKFKEVFDKDIEALLKKRKDLYAELDELSIKLQAAKSQEKESDGDDNNKIKESMLVEALNPTTKTWERAKVKSVDNTTLNVLFLTSKKQQKEVVVSLPSCDVKPTSRIRRQRRRAASRGTDEKDTMMEIDCVTCGASLDVRTAVSDHMTCCYNQTNGITSKRASGAYTTLLNQRRQLTEKNAAIESQARIIVTQQQKMILDLVQ